MSTVAVRGLSRQWRTVACEDARLRSVRRRETLGTRLSRSRYKRCSGAAVNQVAESGYRGELVGGVV